MMHTSHEQVASVTLTEPTERALTLSGRRWRMALLLLMGGGYWFSYACPRSDLPHLPLCFVRAATGIDCPSCGFTRGFLAISQGDPLAASRLNILTVPVYVLGLVTMALLAAEIMTGRDWLNRFLRRHQRPVLAALVSAVAIRYAAAAWWT